MWYKLKRIYVGTTKVRPESPSIVQTFDFQNNWSLNWTGQTIYWTPTLVTWEWWTIGGSWGNTFQSAIMPPSSVYGGTLKKFVLYIYKGVASNTDATVWAGIGTSNLTALAWREQVVTESPRSRAMVYDWAEHYTTTRWAVWEITLQYIFNDDGNLVLKVYDAEYNLWQYASTFRTYWSNGNLWLSIWRWRVADGNIYIRKVEIYTE